MVSRARSGRPARAGWAALRQFRFWGERWSSAFAANAGAAAAAPGARWEVRGHGKQAALKDQAFSAALVLLAPNPRARGARRASDVGQQSDPQSGVSRAAIRPTRSRRLGGASAISFLGRTMELGVRGERWCGRRGAGRALGGTGSWKTRGIERSGVLAALALLAPNPRARGARRASDVGQQSDPQSGAAERDQADPLAPAGRRFGNFVFGANDGARRSRRTLVRPPRRRARAGRYGVMENTRH